MKTTLRFALLILSLATAIPSVAQDARAKVEPAFYRLDFVVKEVENGKVVNTRAYASMISPDGGNGSIRTGQRIPVSTGSLALGAGAVNTQYSYHEAGINIDFSSAKELTDRLALQVTADISSVPLAAETPGLPPGTRTNRWTSFVIVPLRKPTMIFSSDDPASKRQLQLELTATPIK
jgi:hypothetical protein